MPDAPPTDKLQPYLLDRLIDDQPGARQERIAEKAMSLSQFRAAVLRDLRWLLNASAHLPGEFDEFGEVGRSVLNYGVLDLSGRTISGLGLRELEQSLMAAIKAFEPRILPDSLRVSVVVETSVESPNTIALEIRGELWAVPQPTEFHVKTEIDLDTGFCKI